MQHRKLRHPYGTCGLILLLGPHCLMRLWVRQAGHRT